MSDTKAWIVFFGIVLVGGILIFLFMLYRYWKEKHPENVKIRGFVQHLRALIPRLQDVEQNKRLLLLRNNEVDANAMSLKIDVDLAEFREMELYDDVAEGERPSNIGTNLHTCEVPPYDPYSTSALEQLPPMSPGRYSRRWRVSSKRQREREDGRNVAIRRLKDPHPRTPRPGVHFETFQFVEQNIPSFQARGMNHPFNQEGNVQIEHVQNENLQENPFLNMIPTNHQSE